MKKLLMKCKKASERRNVAVSAVIGVILMVAITVAISASVYAYVSGMLGSSASTIPTINFVKQNNKLIVTKADPAMTWSNDISFDVEGNLSNVTKPSNDNVTAGQALIIGNEVDSVTIVAMGFLIGTWEF